MGPRRIVSLSVALMSFALSGAALAETPTTQVVAQTPTGQVVAQGCSAVIVDPQATPGSVACPPATPPQAAPIEAKPKRKWYGWQTLTADGAALAMAYAAANTDGNSSALPLLALGTYALGGPIVHAANGSAGKMGISLGMRVGGPLVLGYGLYALSSSSSNGDSWGPAIMGAFGVVGGMITAVVIDATVLARKTVPADESSEPREEPAPQATTSFRITPAVAPIRGGGTIGAIGTF
jgi:hypothetical protein